MRLRGVVNEKADLAIRQELTEVTSRQHVCRAVVHAVMMLQCYCSLLKNFGGTARRNAGVGGCGDRGFRDASWSRYDYYYIQLRYL